ncbi:LuxR C-terminal-related transcriptional regulator [Bradyrhizobium sp. CB2312]|uniref:LuxR C-terminal-related transcriptional regulator n=1 Tax=Bradyrhizobium sp. CB2312 TaxID=3039155 RepID=UPI0024B18B6C|nr:LuxR C-terminal-related transcriptional regulator [Bradyrhizobium sp. CB2312]WFU76469.1 LuxR C-terminal-related transcriptional regulator [Bradyrhizobium sp. CB2312]
MLDVSANQGIFQRNRIVIVDRQPIVLQGLKSILGAQQDFDVVASCRDATSGLEAIRNLTPDVALISDTLPDRTVTEILAIAKAENVPTRLVFFTEAEANHELTAAIAAGACSAISKYVSPDTMLRLLRLLTRQSVSPEHFDLSPIGREADGAGKIETKLELLTHRERQIVRLVSEGMSNKEIARRLKVSPGTVKVHLYNIFQKLEVTNRTVLATLALLKHPSGFGTLALAFLAIAIADELKASEANDTRPDDDSIGHAGHEPWKYEAWKYEPWKKAILRHLVVWEAGETHLLSQSDFLAKLGQVANAPAAMEALRAAEQSADSKPLKIYGPVGSATPNLPAPLLRATSDTQMGGDLGADHQFPRLASNPMSVQGGYGTFATVAGALIYALHDPHLAVQAHELGQASIDSVVTVAGENAATKLAAIPHANANHDNAAAGLPSHDSRLSSAHVTTGNESVAGEGARIQVSHGVSHGAEGDTLQKPVGLADAGHDASVGGYSRDQLMGGGNGDGNVVHRSPTDSNSTSSQSAFDFASGPGRINLAAFGALAWLHMTAASKSIPPHTLAWIYDAASNETIVYVNPTDRVLDIGDRSLLEIHLQGIVSVAESDVVDQREGAPVAITLEKLEEALTSASAIDGAVLSKDGAGASIEASGSTLGTAGVWAVLADHGLGFQFGQTRTGVGGMARSRTTTGESADAREESHGASGEPVRVSSIVSAHSAAAPAVGNVTSNSGPINADTGVSSGPNVTVQPSVAMADSADRGNSQHTSEPEPAKAAATEPTEADSKPGNGVDNDAERHAADSDVPTKLAKKVKHGDSGHSNSENAPGAAENDPGVAKTESAGHGNSLHASEKGSAKAAATESTEAGVKPGKGAEHHAAASNVPRGLAKKADSSGAEHDKSEHSNSENAPGAAENDPGVAKTESAGHGNSPHASEKGSAKAAATESTEAGVEPGKGAEHHAAASDVPRGAAKKADSSGAEHGKSGHSNSENAPGAAENDPGVAKTESAGHGNSLHASEKGSAKAAATESTEAESKPHNGVGNGAEHHAAASDVPRGLAKKADSSAVEHGNSGHSNSASAPDAGENVELSVVAAASAGQGNSEHTSEPGSAKAAATELPEADFKPGNGVGNGAEHPAAASDAARGAAKTTEPSGAEHGNSGHSNSANAPDAGEVDPTVVTAASEGHGNSQHTSEPGSANAPATESTEADSKPGNGIGNGAEHHAAALDAAATSAAVKTAEPVAVEHGNAEHDLHPTSANAPEVAEIVDPSVATGGNAGCGNSQHASEPGPAKAVATEPTESDFTPGAGVGDEAEQHAPASDPASAAAAVKTEEPVAVDHGNSGHSTAANTPEAAEVADPSVATNGNAERGNSQHAAQSAAIASDDAQPAKVASATGGADQEQVFRFDSEAAPSALVAIVAPSKLDDPLDRHVPPGQQADLEVIAKMVPIATDEHANNHGNSGSHHAIVPAHHDLLV